jgi:hypothetical protein
MKGIFEGLSLFRRIAYARRGRGAPGRRRRQELLERLVLSLEESGEEFRSRR